MDALPNLHETHAFRIVVHSYFFSYIENGNELLKSSVDLKN